MKLVGLLFTILFLIGCNPKKENSTEARVSVSGAGSTNFGKVNIGEYRVAGIAIKNPTSESISYTVSGIAAPFTIDGVSGGCTLVSINPNSDCIIKIRYTPVSAVESFITVSVLGTQVQFRGKGLQQGALQLGVTSWNAGIFKAGEARTTTIPITNIGDTQLSPPQVATPGFSIAAQNCGTEIAPGESCSMVISVQKALAQQYSEIVQFYTVESSTFYDLNFLAEVIPGDPSGTIEFQTGATEIIADNSSTMVITTKPIRDVFGNIVSDGVAVVGTPVNLSVVGSTSQQTLNGVVSFTVRATAFTGTSRLVLSSNLASGVYNLASVSGPPFGTITAKPFNPNVRANGLATLTIETNPLISASGNIVSDGTQVEAFLIGPGTIITTERVTVGGVLRIQIKSSTTATTTKLVLRANPIYSGATITGYQAYGEFDINFIPMDEIGNFDITCNHPAIYYLKNGSGRVDETTCQVVNIRDEFNNPVGSGYAASIALTNGKHSITNMDIFTMTTDALSAVSFPIKGSGVRDYITLDVTINGKSKSHTVFARGDSEILHNKGTTNKIALFSQRASSKFTTNSLKPNVANNWKEVETDYYGIRSLDNSYFGFKKAFGQWREITGPQRHLIWDCLIPVDSYLGTPPCEEKKLLGSGYEYKSYSIHEIKTERTPETLINPNIQYLPSSSSAFDANILGPISAFDKTRNRYHIFGGVVPVEVTVGAATKYTFAGNTDAIAYGDVSLMAFAPFLSTSYTADILFPVAPSYYRYKDDIYIFGGLKKQMPSVVAGDKLQIFKDGDLTTITVGDGAAGSPVGRYQNGVYYDHDTTTLYVFGGRNANGDFLDEIWKTNLSEASKTWTKICNLCGLPDTTSDNMPMIVGLLTTPVDYGVWQSIFEPMRPPVVVKDSVNGRTYFTAPYSSVMGRIRLDTGTFDADDVPDEFLEFRNYGHLVQHFRIDRFYRHDIVQSGTTNTKLYYKDGDKGQMVYYKAEIKVDNEARLFAEEIRPVVSAYSFNRTTRGASNADGYGASVYLFDYSTDLWVYIGESTASSPGLIASDAYSVKPLILNPSRYISSDNKVHVLIKPKHDIGYQIGTSPDPGLNEFYINLIKLEGVF